MENSTWEIWRNRINCVLACSAGIAVIGLFAINLLKEGEYFFGVAIISLVSFAVGYVVAKSYKKNIE